MSTKFYINYGLGRPTYEPPLLGGWTITTYYTNFIIDPISFGEFNTVSYQAVNPAAAPPQKSILLQGISRPLQPQTISGTIDFVLAISEWSLADNAVSRLHVYVANETTNTVFAVLLNQFEEIGGIEWYQNDASGYQPPCKGTKLATPQALTPCTIPSDGNVYRLVVEFGSRTTQIAGSYLKTSLHIGSRPSPPGGPLPDLVVDEVVQVGVNEKAGYFLFSANILLQPMPVTNYAIENATAISSIPTNFLTDTKGYATWFKYTFSQDTLIGIFACTDPMATSVLVYVYGEQYNNFVGPAVNRTPIQLYQLAGTVVYFQTYVDPYVSGLQSKIDIQVGPNEAVKAGDLLILDDCSDSQYPAIWLDSETGTVRRGDTRFIATELAVSLTDGRFGAVYDGPTSVQLVRYNKLPSLTEISRTTFPIAIFPQTLGTDFKDFYIIFWDSPVMPMYKVNGDGTLASETWGVPFYDCGYTSGNGGQGSFGLSRDGLIAYIPNNYDDDFDCSCRRWDMVNNVEILPAFGPPPVVTPTTDFYAGEVIVLSNNTILCNYHKDGGLSGKQYTVHYAVNGAVLHVIDHGHDEVHHITHSADDDPDKFWVWIQPNDGLFDSMNLFRLIKISTGEILVEHASPKFYLGKSSTDAYIEDCDEPMGRFGATNSCPLVIMMGEALTEIPGAGIYELVPNKREDTVYTDSGEENVAIPNPFIKTTFIGS